MKTKGRFEIPLGMPVMPECCKTCPFGENGDEELRKRVESRLMEVSQTCHSTGIAKGKKRDTHLCRGARNFQIQIFYRLGFLEAPTDEAWDKKLIEIGLK